MEGGFDAMVRVPYACQAKGEVVGRHDRGVDRNVYVAAGKIARYRPDRAYDLARIRVRMEV